MAEDKVKFTVEGKGKNLKKTAKEAKAVGDGAKHAQQGLDKASKSGAKFQEFNYPCCLAFPLHEDMNLDEETFHISPVCLPMIGKV